MKKTLLLLLFCLPLFIYCQTISFSENRGFYDSPFNLELNTDIVGGSIRYTLDGSLPTTTTGIIYDGNPFSVNTTTVVRALAYIGLTKSSVETNSYIFLDDVIQQPLNISGWPNNVYNLGSSGATAIHDYEMDPDVVNNPAYNPFLKQGLLSIPTMSIVMQKDDFWEMYDGEAGFPGSIEIIYPDNAFPDEQFDAEMESHSHLRLKRSMKIDINNSVNSNLLKTNPVTGNTATTNFTDTKFILRAGNNRAWSRNWNPDRTVFARDEWYRESQLAASGIGMRGTYVHLYVNGIYWGLYNPVQRQDAGFMSTYFGGDTQDWMTLNHNGISSGDATRFNYLTTTLVNKDMAVQANYVEAKQYIDVEKFIDYLMVTWSMGMTDWPTNNFYGGNRNNPAEPFNYYTWDGEWSWDTTNGSNNGAWVHPLFRNTATSTVPIPKLWHSLRINPEFMQLFVDRVNLQFFNNGPLSDNASRARWASITQYINTAVIAESARWGDAVNDGKTRTKNSDWLPEVARLDGLMNGNANRFITALRAQGYYPSLDAPTFNKPSGSVSSTFELTISNPNVTGTIYYTTDGSDPKLANGDVSTFAQEYSTPLAIPASDILNVIARIKDGSVWSASINGSYAFIELYINEFMASNGTGITDELGANEDWIEFYNAGVLPVDIGGMYITDDLTNPTLWQIPNTSPSTTTIPAGGFLYVWADKETNQGPLHMNIKLSGSGEAIGLSIQGATELETIDSYVFGEQTSDISMGRYPDGSENFFAFDTPTPGAANELGFVSGIYINEFIASNVNGIVDEAGDLEDWIEIYNRNNVPVDIGGMYITDNLANPLLFQLPTDNPTATTIPAGGFIVLWADSEPLEGPLHIGLKLGKGGEAIGLTQVIGSEQEFIDSLTFGAQADDVSTGREPDGGFTFRTYFQPTPGAPNIVPFVSGLSINEALAINVTSISDNNGEKDSWIEIYNLNSTSINIGGLFISDNAGNPSLYQIPTTNPTLTTIPAGGFITLWADNQVVQGELHLPFTLNSGGGTILISDVIGADVSTIDTMIYPGQISDVSYGRYPDASPQFKSFNSPTPNNNNILPLVTNVLINEFLAGNSVINTDDFGEYEDWVELYNAGSSPVDVGGLFIVDDLAETNPFQIPTTAPSQTTIPPGGFLLLWCDNTPTQGVLHMNIKLSGGGEQIGLLQINGTDRTFIDSLTYLEQIDDISEGRSVDGGSTFVKFTSPTPNASNNADTSDTVAPVITLVGDNPQQIVLGDSYLELGATATDDVDGDISENINIDTSALNVAIAGSYEVIYSVSDQAGNSAVELIRIVNVVDTTPTTLSILTIELIDAGKDVSLLSLTDGMSININDLPTLNLSIAVTTTSDVGSVRLQLSGAKASARTENVKPYALYGDTSGNYAGSTFTTGSYVFTGIPYSGSNLGGVQGTPKTISFQISSGPVDNDGDGFNSDVDCNDNDSSIYPGAEELCDGIDNDCDGEVDEGFAVAMYYADSDGDGYGDPGNGEMLCNPISGFVTDNTDCNDNDSSIYPGAEELCDGIDNDCDGEIDENLLKVTYYLDNDGDGYGNPEITIESCEPLAGYVTNNTDCNDGNSSVNPGAIEICDGIDNNCDGLIDDEEIGVNCPTTLSILTIELIDAGKDVSLLSLTDGMSININDLPTLNLSIAVTTTSDVGSVRLQLSGAKASARTENVKPYALYGDTSGNYAGSTFTTGSYVFTGIPYSGSNLGGVQGTPKTISFQIINGIGTSKLESKSIGEFDVEDEILEIEVYPNPASDILFVELSSLKGKEVNLSIYNIIGQQIHTVNLKGSYNYLQEINLARFSEGVYILRMFDEKGGALKTERILIKKK